VKLIKKRVYCQGILRVQKKGETPFKFSLHERTLPNNKEKRRWKIRLGKERLTVPRPFTNLLYTNYFKKPVRTKGIQNMKIEKKNGSCVFKSKHKIS